MKKFLSGLALGAFVIATTGQANSQECLSGGDRRGSEVRKKGDVAVASTIEGVFLGIEWGDYAHWTMSLGQKKEVSYFILQPDATVEKVLENPEGFIGRKCRVVWKKTTEDLPEAGGQVEVEQMVSVEWLDHPKKKAEN